MINSNVFAGYSEADITPEGPVELIGFSRPDNMSKGVLHRIIAQVLVWRSPNESCCLIVIDSLGFTVDLANELRDKAADRLDVKREEVMICFSHTHSAPNAGNNRTYYDFACMGILRAIDDAVRELVPVKAAWGLGENRIGLNRRGNEGAVDARLGVLKITDAISEKARIAILRVTAHANVLTSDNYCISPDYIGTARDLIQKRLGCKVIIVQGASGDIIKPFSTF